MEHSSKQNGGANRRDKGNYLVPETLITLPFKYSFVVNKLSSPSKLASHFDYIPTSSIGYASH